MKIPLRAPKLNMFLHIKRIPFVFERFELAVVIFGAAVAFVLAGLLFYQKAYKTVTIPPEVEVRIPKINEALFNSILNELEQKKQLPSSEPIVDPFR